MSLDPNDAIVHVDFGGGWRYGFPRVYSNPADLPPAEYLVQYGVPRWLATQEANNLRFWSHPAGSVPLKGLPDVDK